MKIYPQLTSDAEFQSLGDLGYTGTINDRQYGFLSDRGLLGALSDMLYAWRTDPAKGYSANNLVPNLMMDFTNSFFVSDATVTTFDDAFTHAASSNATMVDSDGLLKWRPHNLLTYSEDFSNAAWTKISGGAGSAPTVTSSNENGPNGSSTGVFRVQASTGGGTGGADYSLVRQPITLVVPEGDTSFGIWLKSNDGTTQTITTSYSGTPNTVTVTTGWQLVTVAPNVGGGNLHECDIGVRGDTTDASCDVLIYGAHLYRSDLGGMVDNPDRGDSYVPTTSAAVYLPRRGHHVWNGSDSFVANVSNGVDADEQITVSFDTTDDGDGTVSASGSVTGATLTGDLTYSIHLQDGMYPQTVRTGTLTLNTDGTWAYGGSAWVDEGILHESEARTNLVLNSATLATQDVTVTAVPHTLHFTGTGTVTLSGASTAGPLVGTGTGENNRVSLTFTPSAGTLTLTVSGTVTNADLEVGSTLSSHKPTSGSTATRAAETLTIPAETLIDAGIIKQGPELVANGTFDTDVSGWTAEGANTVTYSSGTAVLENVAGANQGFYQSISTEVGKVYKVVWDVVTITSNNPSVLIGASAGSSGIAGPFNSYGASETGTAYFVATGASTVLTFRPNNTTIGRTYSFDNISVRELSMPGGAVIGEELVTNGTFDADSDWTKGTGWTIGSGVASSAGSNNLESLSQSVSLSTGSVYLISWDVSGYSSGAVRPEFFGGGSAAGALVNANGSYTQILTVDIAYTGFRFLAVGGSGFTGSIDNVSVREIDPLAVSIAMEGRMTYADDGAFIGSSVIRWYVDGNNFIDTLVRADGNLGQVLIRQRESGVNDQVFSATGTYSPGVLVPFNIASRHGSTFINGAVDGVALTADTTPVALPDLSATDLNLGYDYMGTIKTFRIWDKDIGDTGIAGASS